MFPGTEPEVVLPERYNQKLWIGGVKQAAYPSV